MSVFMVKGCYKRANRTDHMTKVFVVWDPLAPAEIETWTETGPLLCFKVKKLVHEIIVSSGGMLQHGAPPRGEMERVIQRRLKSLQGKMGADD